MDKHLAGEGSNYSHEEGHSKGLSSLPPVFKFILNTPTANYHLRDRRRLHHRDAILHCNVYLRPTYH